VASPSCPGNDDLRQFRLGQSAEVLSQQIEAHLATCPACLQRLSAIPLDDPIVQSLRAARNRPRLRNPILDQAQQEARNQLPRSLAVPVATAVPVGPGPSLNRRWLILGGAGVLALLILILIIVNPFRSRTDPTPPRGDDDTEEDKPIARLRAKPSSQRAKEQPALTMLDPEFRETWVTKPGALDGVKNWTIESKLENALAPQAFYFTDDERMLVRYGHEHWLQFDPATSGFVAAPHGGLFQSIPLNARQCARTSGVKVELWEEGGNRPWTMLDGGGWVGFSPDGTILASVFAPPSSGGEKWLDFWETREGSSLARLSIAGSEFDSLPLAALAWSPDSKIFAISSNKGIHLNRAPWKSGDTVLATPQRAHALAWSPTGKQLATVEADRKVRIVEVAHPERLETLADFTLPSASLIPAWSPDGKELALATEDRKVIVWDRKAKKAICTLSGHTRPITMLAFLGDGKTLVSATAADLRFWDLEKGTVRGTLFAFLGGEHIAISPEGYYRGTPNTERRFLFRAREESNQVREFSPADFSRLYGWKNQPERVVLVGE
jgi:hypothetical protein